MKNNKYDTISEIKLIISEVMLQCLFSMNTSLTLPLFFKVPVPWQKMEWSCSCVLGVSILPLSTIFLLDFGHVLTVWYFSIRFWTCSDSMKWKTKNNILSEHVQNLIEKYHTVRTCPKSNRKIPYCQNISKI
jgi:hypothetical protein